MSHIAPIPEVQAKPQAELKLGELAECADRDALLAARNALITAHAALATLSPSLKNRAADERLSEIGAALEEEIAGLACVAERCAEQEEIGRRDWHATAWASYHDANRG